MAAIELRKVSKAFGATEAVRGASMHIGDREFMVFVGPSGCGKSTLLRLVAGLETPSGGAIHIDGIDATNTPPAKRGLAMVFQSYALYPHMTVYGNIAFPLKMAGDDREMIDRKVQNAARILNLGECLQRKPRQLSGGQRQRVAIGRAIVREPKAFLFDEPLSNLDAALRVQMRMELGELHRQLQATMIYVTHDQVEAMTMADRIAVLNKGQVEQTGAPRELYHHPANRFVAGFIGSPAMNFIGGEQATKDNATTIGARPEDITVGKAENDKDGRWRGKVLAVEHLGADSFVHVHGNDTGKITARVRGGENGGDSFAVGDAVVMTPRRLYRFDKDGKTIGGKQQQ
ncbi:MAG: ABC transporter ATP-binding protein [Gammaproteobacteria bacterium]